MSTATADYAVKDQITLLTRIKKNFSSALSSYDLLWDLVDGATDMDYENTVKGQEITDIDNSLREGKIGALAVDWFNFHESYYQQKRGYAGGFVDWLLDNHYRVSEVFAAIYFEARGTDLSPNAVYAEEELATSTLGTITNGVSALVNDGQLPDAAGDNRLGLKVTTTLTDDTSFTLSLGDTLDETTRDIALTIPSATAEDTWVYIGEVTPTAVVASGDGLSTILTVPNIAFFRAETYVLVNSDGDLESVLVSAATPTSGGAGTLTVPLLKFSALPAVTRVYPMFNRIEEIEVTASDVGAISIGAVSDRLIVV